LINKINKQKEVEKSQSDIKSYISGIKTASAHKNPSYIIEESKGEEEEEIE
jgi:hypothetical protein